MQPALWYPCKSPVPSPQYLAPWLKHIAFEAVRRTFRNANMGPVRLTVQKEEHGAILDKARARLIGQRRRTPPMSPNLERWGQMREHHGVACYASTQLHDVVQIGTSNSCRAVIQRGQSQQDLGAPNRRCD